MSNPPSTGFDPNQPPAEMQGGQPWLAALAGGGSVGPDVYKPSAEDKKWYTEMALDMDLLSNISGTVGGLGCVLGSGSRGELFRR